MAGDKNYCSIKVYTQEAQNLHQLKSPLSNPTSKTVSYEVNLTLQHSHLEVLLLSKFGLKGGISIDADSGPLRHVL